MSTGSEFMRMTQYANMGDTDQMKGLPQPPLEQPVPEGAALFDLPAPSAVGLAPLDFVALLERRETLRRYADEPLTLAELAYLLWAAQGVTKIMAHSTRRTVPSAGARHAFETYVLVNRVDGLAPGLYRYVALSHQLLAVEAPADISARLAFACHEQKQVALSAATLIWAADVYRMAYRYGERGYRYLHLDAGHACQNLYLAAETIRCGVCAIAAFDDVQINSLLGLDGESQFVVYVGTVGKRK